MSPNLARRGTSEVIPPPATENAACSAPPTAGKYDSALVGRVVQRRPHDPSESPKNVTLSLWSVTWWLKLRKLGETEPSEDGTFTLPFDLRQARNWRTASLHVDVTREVDEGSQGFTLRLELLGTISVRARELVGMRYNLHTVELPESPLGIIDANCRRYVSERGSRRRLHRPNDATAVPAPLEIVPNRSVDDVCRECKRKSRIRYKYRDAFFVPGRFRINHAELGRSKIIHNRATILAEFFYLAYESVVDALRFLRAAILPRPENVRCRHPDSTLVGRVVHPSRNRDFTPIHNLEVRLWGCTWWFRWRKLAEGYTGPDGRFALPFELRQARNWFTPRLRFDVSTLKHVVYRGDEPEPITGPVHVANIPRTDLVGMRYDLGTLQLPFWEYRTDCGVPRAAVHEGERPCEHYARSRVRALYQQIIPFELTKRKHLFQIRYAPETIDLAKIQADYPVNLTVCIEKDAPGYTRSDAWLGERMMNGMNRGAFLPDRRRPGHYWIKYYGICGYDHNDEYALPDVEALFQISGEEMPRPFEIRLIGRVTALEREPRRLRVFTPADGDEWLAAKRVLRVAGAFATEVDEHFAGTHLNAEQYSIAAHRNLRRNPVAWLLYPHLKEVSLINASADKLLIRDYLPRATALSARGIQHRTRDILGMQDWKGWKPRSPLHARHTCARAENLFWAEVVRPFVDEFFERHIDAIKAHWNEVFAFSEDLVSHSVPVFLSDVADASPEERSRLEYDCFKYTFDPSLPRRTVDGRLRVISPITASRQHPGNEDVANLKAACRYAIMMATYMHTWINEHQYADLGEVLYSCGGLRFGSQRQGILTPESDLSIAPDLTRSTEMLWFTNFLSRTEYGFITKDEEHDVHPEFRQHLLRWRAYFRTLDVDVTALESRTNI